MRKFIFNLLKKTLDEQSKIELEIIKKQKQFEIDDLTRRLNILIDELDAKKNRALNNHYDDIQKSIDSGKLKINLALAEDYVKGNKDKHEYECKWHNEREQRTTELAKLDAQIEEKQKFLNYLDEIDSSCEAEIQRLNNIILELIKKLGSSDMSSIKIENSN